MKRYMMDRSGVYLFLTRAVVLQSAGGLEEKGYVYPLLAGDSFSKSELGWQVRIVLSAKRSYLKNQRMGQGKKIRNERQGDKSVKV